jgi:sporulation protein YlmC with PRC-barrel domain
MLDHDPAHQEKPRMNKTVLSLAAALAISAAVPAIAQQTATRPAVAIPKGVFFKGQSQGQMLARDRLLGLSVHDASGKIVGDVEDLIVGPNNEIQGVIMGTGGFFGAGEKRVGVRISAIQISTKDGKTVLTVPAATKEVLSALEPYKRAEPRRSLADRARDKAQELTDKTKDSAGPAYEQAKEKAKQAYESARDQAGPAYEQAKEKAKQAYEAAREQAGPAYETAKTAAKDAYDKAMQSAREAYDKATTKPTDPAAPKQ